MHSPYPYITVLQRVLIAIRGSLEIPFSPCARLTHQFVESNSSIVTAVPKCAMFSSVFYIFPYVVEMKIVVLGISNSQARGILFYYVQKIISIGKAIPTENNLENE